MNATSNSTTNPLGIRVFTAAGKGGTALNIANGNIRFSETNGYVSNQTVDDADLIVKVAGPITIPMDVITNDGMHIWVINNSGGQVTVSNTTDGPYSIPANRAAQFIYRANVALNDWIPVN